MNKTNFLDYILVCTSIFFNMNYNSHLYAQSKPFDLTKKIYQIEARIDPNSQLVKNDSDKKVYIILDEKNQFITRKGNFKALEPLEKLILNDENIFNTFLESINILKKFPENTYHLIEFDLNKNKSNIFKPNNVLMMKNTRY